MTELELFLQQAVIGLSNGMIIALVALGYTMVYGIIELINFAHGDVFMLGAFLALTLVGVLGLDAGTLPISLSLVLLFTTVPCFTAGINYFIDRVAYKPLRGAPRLAPLVSAIGASFILLNIGLFWGGLPLPIFNEGRSAAAPKNFPSLIPNLNLFEMSAIQFTVKDLLVYGITVPLFILLTLFIKYTRYGKAMRAVAQNPVAAQLMGINVNKVISSTFLLGGALAGVASVVYALYNNSIYFQMGFRIGMDAFTAAVLGGIGNLFGAMFGGLLIGIIRSMTDQYIDTSWTNVVVFSILVLILVFRPSGLLGSHVKEKV